jgi:streptomycin 6-kinase
MLPRRDEASAQERLAECAREWRVIVDETFETGTSVIAFGQRATLPVVLKVAKNPGDEWRCGDVLDAFGGRGVVRVYEYTAGAALLERAVPGQPLSELSLTGRDDEATEALADVIGRMSPSHSASCPTVEDWTVSFDRYIATGAGEIPSPLVAEARPLYAALCASQTRPRLLHGDLQHYNILFDAGRGWLAIDPKGVVGEIECEIGPALRNPFERPDVFANPVVIEKRLASLASRLHLDPARALGWTFALAVLSAIWDVEDGNKVDSRHPSVLLAEAVRPLLPHLGWR